MREQSAPLVRISEVHLTKAPTRQPGIQSVEVAGKILHALIDEPGALALSTVAARSKMPATKVRRYLVSLIRLGLVSQNDETGRYDFGPLALNMGIAALSRFDAVRKAGEQLAEIRRITGETTFLSVRGRNGATVIQVRENLDPISLRARVGATLPLLTTATGWVFISFDPVIEREYGKPISSYLDKTIDPALVLAGHDGLAARAADIRSTGYAAMDDVFQAGVSAISAPVLGSDGALLAALTVVLPRDRARPDNVASIGELLRSFGLMKSPGDA